MTPETTEYPKAVAAELRAQMARKQASIADLADILGLEPRAARRRYDGEKPMTVSEIDRAAAWLGIDRQQLLQVEAAA